MDRPALWTGPLPDIEAQLIELVAAFKTELAGREEAIDLYEGSTIPVSLVLQLSHDLSKRDIEDRPVQPGLLFYHFPGILFIPAGAGGHTLHVQVFDDDHLVVVDQSRRDLMNMVAAGITDPGMKMGDAVLGFGRSVRLNLLAG